MVTYGCINKSCTYGVAFGRTYASILGGKYPTVMCSENPVRKYAGTILKRNAEHVSVPKSRKNRFEPKLSDSDRP